MTTDFFTSVLNNYLTEPQASLLNGIIFGHSLQTSKVFYNEIKIVGLLHLVVLSGTNITILTSILADFLSFFSKRISTLITILAIILFVLFVGMEAPIIRAAFMSICTLVAIIYGKKDYSWLGLVLSLVFIYIFFRDWLGTISLQLSYAATVGILLVGQTTSKNRLWRQLKISLAAQAFTTPIIFMYFHQVSLISPVSNLLMSELVAPLMIFGFLAAILGKISYFLGLFPAYICQGLLTYMVWIIETLSKIPFAFYQF